MNGLSDTVVEESFVLTVGDTERLSNKDYSIAGVLDCAQIQALEIGEEEVYTFDQFLSDKSNSNSAIIIAMGAIGGVFALIGIVSLFGGRRKK